MREENRGPWYLLTGLILGAVVGLAYAWLFNPVQFIDTTPDSLRPEFKEQYRSLIALAYRSNGDLGRARQRLALLQDSAPAAELVGQAQRLKAKEGENEEALALLALAQNLQTPMPPTAAGPDAALGTEVAGQDTSPEPSATLPLEEMIRTATLPPPTPRPTFTPRPTMTPRANLGAPFELKDRQLVCEGSEQPVLLQIETIDAQGKSVAGVAIAITWEGGQETFYTGLNPKVSPGYADFEMDPEKEYSVQVGAGSKPVTGVRAEKCDSSGGSFTGGIKLVFGQ